MRRPSKPPSTIIDAEKMPFSEAELYAAFHLIYSIRTAKQLAREVADGIRDERWSEASAAATIARGSRDPENINSHVYMYPAIVLFLLALLSPRLHDRVMAWRAADRERTHRHRMIEATFSLTGSILTEQWPEEAVRQVRSQYAAEEAKWVEGLTHFRGQQVTSALQRMEKRAPPVRGKLVAVTSSLA